MCIKRAVLQFSGQYLSKQAQVNTHPKLTMKAKTMLSSRLILHTQDIWTVKEKLSDFNVSTWSCWDAFPGALYSAEVMLRTRIINTDAGALQTEWKALLSLKPIQWWRERGRKRGATKRALFRLETCAAYVSNWERAQQQTLKRREALRSCRTTAWHFCYAVVFCPRQMCLSVNVFLYIYILKYL